MITKINLIHLILLKNFATKPVALVPPSGCGALGICVVCIVQETALNKGHKT